jgi:hypothetical protein
MDALPDYDEDRILLFLDLLVKKKFLKHIIVDDQMYWQHRGPLTMQPS